MFWGWGSWQPGRGMRWGGGFFFLPLILCCGVNWLFNVRGGLSWIGILLVVIGLVAVLPTLMRTVNAAGYRAEKAKRDEYSEEPAPDSDYVLGDDGEIIPRAELDKPKRDDYV